MYRLLCIINRQNVVIKIPLKALEGIHTAKIIEGKTNKILHKTLEGIRTPKTYSTYIALMILKIIFFVCVCVYIKLVILPKKCMKTMA